MGRRRRDSPAAFVTRVLFFYASAEFADEPDDEKDYCEDPNDVKKNSGQCECDAQDNPEDKKEYGEG